MKLPKWTETVERFVDRAIPFMLLILTLIIIAEFMHWAEGYGTYLQIADISILSFFIVDLSFKWHHTKNMQTFVKLYWIDIIAVFPFYLFFRVFLFAQEIVTAGEQTQKLLHESALLRELRFLRETELLKEAQLGSKAGRIGRLFSQLPRSLRLLRARWYVAHGRMQDVSKIYRSEHRKNKR